MTKSNVKIPRSKVDDLTNKSMKIEIKKWIGEGTQFIDIKFINSNQVISQRFSLNEFELLKRKINELD